MQHGRDDQGKRIKHARRRRTSIKRLPSAPLIGSKVTKPSVVGSYRSTALPCALTSTRRAETMSCGLGQRTLAMDAHSGWLCNAFNETKVHIAEAEGVDARGPII